MARIHAAMAQIRAADKAPNKEQKPKKRTISTIKPQLNRVLSSAFERIKAESPPLSILSTASTVNVVIPALSGNSNSSDRYVT